MTIYFLNLLKPMLCVVMFVFDDHLECMSHALAKGCLLRTCGALHTK